MVKRFIALALWLSLIGTAYGQVPDRPPTIPPVEDFHCITAAKEVIAQFGLGAANDSDDELEMYAGEKAKAILKEINESPPPTHYKADSLFVILHHGSEGSEEKGAVLAFMISDDCVTGVLPKIPMGAWAHIISKSIGDDL